MTKNEPPIETQSPALSIGIALSPEEQALVDAIVVEGERENTSKTFDSAIRHFRESFGGYLPATPQAIQRYILTYRKTHKASTLDTRLSMIARWHNERRLPDPTKVPEVKKLLKGVRSMNKVPPKQARPLGLTELRTIVEGLEQSLRLSDVIEDKRARRARQLKDIRDKAFLLMGFWFAWRSDELVRLTIDGCSITLEDGRKVLTVFLPYTKGDRNADGATWRIVETPQNCPVAAFEDWVDAAQIKTGPLFSAIDRWGNMANRPLDPTGIIKLMHAAMARAGLSSDDIETYSSHSMRRGFANWATYEADFNAQELMDWVGWGSIETAIRYLKANAVLHKKIADHLERLPLNPALTQNFIAGN